jgi:hypothetical protein
MTKSIASYYFPFSLWNLDTEWLNWMNLEAAEKMRCEVDLISCVPGTGFAQIFVIIILYIYTSILSRLFQKLLINSWLLLVLKLSKWKSSESSWTKWRKLQHTVYCILKSCFRIKFSRGKWDMRFCTCARIRISYFVLVFILLSFAAIECWAFGEVWDLLKLFLIKSNSV